MNTQQLFAYWTKVRAGLLEALDSLSEEQLDFVPREGLRSLKENVCHIAGTEEGWFRYGVTREINSWDEAEPNAADYPTKAALKDMLARIHAKTETFFAQEPDALAEKNVVLAWGRETTVGWVLWHVIEHEIHHRGEVYLMLGLMGIEAPDV